MNLTQHQCAAGRFPVIEFKILAVQLVATLVHQVVLVLILAQGIAQIPVAGHYDPNATIASFVGFFPVEDPKVTMLVPVNKPKTSIYGSETAAPIFFSVARDIIQHLEIPPSY